MEQQAIDAALLAGSADLDLSIWSLVVRADLIVKVVLVILLAASIWSWAIIFEKLRRVRYISGKAEGFEESFWSGGSLDDLYDRIGKQSDHPMGVLFAAAMREWRRSESKGLTRTDRLSAGLRDRIHQVMRLSISREMERLERHIGFLATVGSTAPFVGLFGTVWGIMNSFQSIAVSKNTSLAVVAPGIAEALFATAFGLIAAIPAVVAYNKFSNDLGRVANRLEGFAAEFAAILSRQLDERAA
ncbi:MAG TPA: protein TolQ [Alphaproteobacteria bacterium]|nr:protein TolQ [Alphaproteobacteria bacterium]